MVSTNIIFMKSCQLVVIFFYERERIFSVTKYKAATFSIPTLSVNPLPVVPKLKLVAFMRASVL